MNKPHLQFAIATLFMCSFLLSSPICYAEKQDHTDIKIGMPCEQAVKIVRNQQNSLIFTNNSKAYGFCFGASGTLNNTTFPTIAIACDVANKTVIGISIFIPFNENESPTLTHAKEAFLKKNGKPKYIFKQKKGLKDNVILLWGDKLKNPFNAKNELGQIISSFPNDLEQTISSLSKDEIYKKDIERYKEAILKLPTKWSRIGYDATSGIVEYVSYGSLSPTGAIHSIDAYKNLEMETAEKNRIKF